MVSSYNGSEAYSSSSVLVNLLEEYLSTLVIMKMTRVLTLLIVPILGLSGIMSLLLEIS